MNKPDRFRYRIYKTKFIFLLLGLICMTQANAQTYEGTIGRYQIYLDLDLDYNDNRVVASYFYNSQLKNILLEGTYDGKTLILHEQYSSIEEANELFTLSIEDDKITGIWKSKYSPLPVELTKTNKSLEDVKAKKLTFVRDSITTYNAKELVWFKEKYSEKMLFRLGNGFTKSERDFVNPKLDAIHLEFATIGLECSSADISVVVELVSNEYLSFSEYSSIYCGGAHPSYNKSSYNFDLKNKKQLGPLTDLYPVLNHYELLKSKYENDTDLQEECEYFAGEYVWEYYSWYLTKDGVTITPQFPHALTPCEEGFPLTYEELQN